MQGEIVLRLYNLASGYSEIIRYFKWVFVLLLIILVICMLKKKKAVFHAILAGFIALIINSIIRFLTYFPRPFVEYGLNPLIKHTANSSFPSNHAAISFAIAASILFYNKRIGVLALFTACGISLLRVMAAIHYPMDIFIGAAIGTFVAIILWFILK